MHVVVEPLAWDVHLHLVILSQKRVRMCCHVHLGLAYRVQKQTHLHRPARQLGKAGGPQEETKMREAQENLASIAADRDRPSIESALSCRYTRTIQHTIMQRVQGRGRKKKQSGEVAQQ